MDHYARAYRIYGKIRGIYSRRFQDILCSLRRFSRSEVAKHRMKIIKFYEQYGAKAMKEAFGGINSIIRGAGRIYHNPDS